MAVQYLQIVASGN